MMRFLGTKSSLKQFQSLNKNDLFSQYWSPPTIKKVVAHCWPRLPLLFK